MDRLSDLPDALLHHILSFMPMQDVVKTTILSKRWTRLWVSVPDLFLDLYSSTFHSHHRLVDFFNRSLIFRRQGKVKTFKIELFLSRNYQRDLDLWIRYAMDNDVEELFLDLVGDQIFYALPQFSYSCSSVEVLRLSMCTLALDKQISWTSLKSLTLRHVHLWEEVIQKVLLGCSNLESLEVSYCRGFNGLSTNSTCLKSLIITLDSPSAGHDPEPVLRISAPNVIFLQLSGFLYRRCLLGDMSSLVRATLDFKAKLYHVERFDDHQNMLLEVFQSLDHVENLTMGSWCIKVLAIKEKKSLVSPPSKRKCLTLATPIMQEDLPGILHLLKCSPNLETLILDMAASSFQELLYNSELGRLAGFQNFGGEIYLESQENTTHLLLSHLKLVKISHFVDQNSALLLIELLLKKAEVLENMVIRAKKTSSISPESAQKLLAIPRSSPGSVVIYAS